jgi:hypothetical protein
LFFINAVTCTGKGKSLTSRYQRLSSGTAPFEVDEVFPLEVVAFPSPDVDFGSGELPRAPVCCSLLKEPFDPLGREVGDRDAPRGKLAADFPADFPGPPVLATDLTPKLLR